MIRVVLLLLTAGCGLNLGADTHGVCGTDAAIDSAPDSAIDSPPPPRSATLIMGQSNAEGMADATELDAIDPALRNQFPAVTQRTKIANSSADPPAWAAVYDGPLYPRVGLKFGSELTLGRAMPDHDIIECAVGGASLWNNWDPNGTYPTGQTNLYHQCVDFAHAAEALHGTQIVDIIWIQGESDTDTVEHAQAYGANLVEISGLLLAEFPCAGFVYNRLHANGPGINLSTSKSPYVRSGQDVASGGAWMTEVNADALAMSGQHFTGQGYVDLGNLFASIMTSQAARCP